MNTDLEHILVLAVSWITAQEQLILQRGVPLTAEQIEDARYAGVQHPEKIRVLEVAELPMPENDELLYAGQKAGLFSAGSIARAARYGIVLRVDLKDKRKWLVHEFVHTAQYERCGGIEPFLQQYVTEVKTYGYAGAPMELEANDFSAAKELDAGKGLGGAFPIQAPEGWFDTPLRRDPRLVVKPEAELRIQTDKRAYVFLGAIRADDSVEIVCVRNSDPYEHCGGHEQFGWGLLHKRFRWFRQGLLTGYASTEQIDIEERWRVESAIQRHVEKLKVGADTEPSFWKRYDAIPFKSAGTNRAGASCTGLTWLWISENTDFHPPAPTLQADVPMEIPNMPVFKTSDFQKGDVVFFRHRKSGKILHCAVCIGPNRYLHAIRHVGSRIDNGFVLMKRAGFDLVGALSPQDAYQFYLEVQNFHTAESTPAEVLAT